MLTFQLCVLFVGSVAMLICGYIGRGIQVSHTRGIVLWFLGVIAGFNAGAAVGLRPQPVRQTGYSAGDLRAKLDAANGVRYGWGRIPAGSTDGSGLCVKKALESQP